MDSSAYNRGYPTTIGRVVAILGLVASVAIVAGGIGVSIGASLEPSGRAPGADPAVQCLTASEAWSLTGEPLPAGRKWVLK